MAENHIDFRYQVMYRTLWDPCVLITVLALFDGYVLRKTRRFSKTDMVLASSRRNGMLQKKFSNKCRIIFNGWVHKNK
jgi:hypothetical protein